MKYSSFSSCLRLAAFLSVVMPRLFFLIRGTTCFSSLSSSSGFHHHHHHHPLSASNHRSVFLQPLVDTLSSSSSSLTRHHHQYPYHPSSSPLLRRATTTTTTTTTTSLHSLAKLVEDVVTTAATSVRSNNNKNKKQKTIFVGGKGGVGKTTISSALAVHLASQQDTDVHVLIVSTDPAHSLGDALDVDHDWLHSNNSPKARVLTDPLTGGRLSAMEVDAAAALEEFRNNLQAFDVTRLAEALGVSADLLNSLGLQDFAGMLNNPPPGLDELVALSNVLSSTSNEYDVIIVDTAPTGHTLRLLALPQFLDGLLGKLIQLRMKLSGLASTLQAFFGSDAKADERARAIDTAMDRLELFRTKMSTMRQRLQDATQTSFVVVTVPTKLSVAESKRLIHELHQQGVAVTDIVINQCVVDMDGSNAPALETYYERRKAGQDKWTAKLQEVIDDVSASPEYQSNGSNHGAKGRPIAVTKVPFFDVELVGVPALAYVGRECFIDNPNFEHLMTLNDDDGDENDDEPKVVICGGKGGVGKTTTSAALAVSMAAKGHNVALISTDPAHSLGDVIDMNLAGGKLMDCPLIGVPNNNNNNGDVGSLSVMEIDPTSALSKFKGLVDQLIGGSNNDKKKKGGAGTGVDDIRTTLADLEEVFDTLPAGTDEVVALATVVNVIKKQGGYDRIVLDTAPTGHTLRMLSTPGFLADLIDRLLNIAQKVNSNAAIRMLITSAAAAAGSGGSSSDDMEAAATMAKSTLLSFQLQMYDLEDIFYNPDQTEFVIVTIPTELAVRESVRLLNDLTFESSADSAAIKVRNVVINQVLRDDGQDLSTFLAHVADGQAVSIQELEQAVAAAAAAASNSSKLKQTKPVITRVPFLDTEPRGVFGLNVLAKELLKE